MSTAPPWCRVKFLGADGSALTECVLRGAGHPDLGAVDVVARLALLARRRGGDVVLAEVSTELSELLALAGLRVEVEGEPEGREESLRVEEVEEERGASDAPA